MHTRRSISVYAQLLVICGLCVSSLVGAETITRDAVGRILQVDHGDGTLTNYSYDASGNRLSRNRIDNRRTIAVTVDPPNSGTITGDGPSVLNSTASLSASPAGGFLFTGWYEAGTLVSSSTPYSFTVTTSRALTAKFVLNNPEIAIEDPSTTPATDLIDGVSSLSFGSQLLQTTTSKTLTVRNSGNAPLTGLNVTIDGTANAEFSVSTLPASLTPGSTTTFTVQFTPTISGTRSAALHITSNDSNESPFDLAIGGEGTANTTPAVRFSDDFSSSTINSSKWTTSGNSVSIGNGVMKVEQNQTDAGGNLTSLPFPVASHQIITISRRVNLHYANSFYAALMQIDIGTLPRFGMSYENYSYVGPYDVARYGFFMTRNSANSHTVTGQADTSAAIPAVWDTWFNERLTYNTDTGVAEYFINDVSKLAYNVGILPATVSPMMTLSFGSWGWFTGHYHWFDDLVVTTTALPADGQSEIAIEDPSTTPATDLVDGVSSLSFGSQFLQSTNSRTLTIRNTGNAPLTGLSATIDGSALADFSPSTLPTSIAAGSSVTLTIQFTANTLGTRTAFLHIASSDTDENPFDILLNGTATCPAISVTNPAVLAGKIGVAFNQTFVQGGGLGVVAFSLASGDLPNGITLSASGVLSGIPTQTGSFPITVRATDNEGCTVTGASYALMVVSNNLAHGSLDSTFGSNGQVTTSFGGNAVAFGVALQPDGKSVVAGFAFNNGKNRFAVARYNTDGSLDPTFNGSGKVITSVSGGEDEAHCLALQPDGKIVVAGFTRPSNAEVAIVRYNTDGSLDTSFGTGGMVITPVAEGDDDARAIAIQPDGKIVLAGYGYRSGGTNDFIVLRYNTNGSLDDTFATGGKLILAFGESYDSGYGMALQPDGKIIAVGSTYDGLDHWAIARITASGALDTTFNGNGKVITSFGSHHQSASSVALQADGRIIVGGEASINGQYDFALARYNTDGSLDPLFGTGGKVLTDWHGQMDLGRSVSIQRDGKIVLAGFGTNTSNNFDMAVACYRMDGSLDPSFGTSGKTLIPVGLGDDRAQSLVLAPFGSATIAGQSFDGTNTVFAVTKINTSINVPDIDVEQPAGSPISFGATANFGSVTKDSDRSLTFTIRNSGNSDLTGITSSIDGVDASMFTVTTSPASTVPSSSVSTTLSVRFLPTSLGVKTATLHIASNDPDENPYRLNLSGVSAYLMPSFDEDLSFDDNQVPAGWTLGYPYGGPGRNASIINQRFDVRQVDTYGGLDRNKQLPASAGKVVISYTGNVTGNYWGQNTQIQFITTDDFYSATFGKSGNGDSTMRSIVGQDAAQTAAFQRFDPLETGTYRMVAVFEDSQVTYTITKQGANTPLVNEVVSLPTLQIRHLQTLRLFSLTTSGDPSWIDDVSIRALPMSPTESWRQQYFGSTHNGGDGADDSMPMHDGIANLMKFATGMDPTKSGSNPGSAARLGGSMTFTYIRSKAAVIEGLSFAVEWSDTLAANSWSRIGVNETAVDQGATEIVTATLPAGSSSRRFVRLRVSRP